MPTPSLQAQAQSQLNSIAARLDLSRMDATLAIMFNVSAPELRVLTTPAEMGALIEAVRSGTANEAQLNRFVELVNHIGAGFPR
jgi:hypothetical protein